MKDQLNSIEKLLIADNIELLNQQDQLGIKGGLGERPIDATGDGILNPTMNLQQPR